MPQWHQNNFHLHLSNLARKLLDKEAKLDGWNSCWWNLFSGNFFEGEKWTNLFWNLKWRSPAEFLEYQHSSWLETIQLSPGNRTFHGPFSNQRCLLDCWLNQQKQGKTMNNLLPENDRWMEIPPFVDTYCWKSSISSYLRSPVNDLPKWGFQKKTSGSQIAIMLHQRKTASS